MGLIPGRVAMVNQMKISWIPIGTALFAAAAFIGINGRGIEVDRRASPPRESSGRLQVQLGGASQEAASDAVGSKLVAALVVDDIEDQTDALVALKRAIAAGAVPRRIVMDILLGRTELGDELPQHVLDTCLLWVAAWRGQLLRYVPDVCLEARSLPKDARRVRALRILTMLGPLGESEASSVLALLEACPKDDNVYEVILGHCAGAAYTPLASRLLHWVTHRQDPARVSSLHIDRRIKQSRGSDGYRPDLERLGALQPDVLRDYYVGVGRVDPSNRWWSEPFDPRRPLLEAVVDTGDGKAIADVLLRGDDSAKVGICLAIRWGVELDRHDRSLVAGALSSLYATAHGRVKGWALRSMGALKPETSEFLIRELTEAENVGLRHMALGSLSWKAGQHTVDRIAALIRAGEVPADSYAASYLADSDGDASGLIPELLNGYDGEIHSVDSLARIALRAPEKLLSGFTSESRDVERLSHEVAAALFDRAPKLPVPPALTPHLEKSASGVDRELRRYAAIALAGARPDVASRGLAEALGSQVRSTAFYGVRAVSRGGASLRHLLPRLLEARNSHQDEETDELVSQALLSIIDGEYELLSSWPTDSSVPDHLAVEVLRQGGQSAVGWMSGVLSGARDARLKRVCAEGLRRVAASSGRDDGVQEGALAALGQVLDAPDPVVRYHAASAWTAARRTGGVEALLRLLDLQSPPNWEQILDALERTRLTAAQVAMLRPHVLHKQSGIARRASALIRHYRLHAD